MAISYIGSATAYPSGSYTIPPIEAGDLIVVLLRVGSATAPTISGWTTKGGIYNSALYYGYYCVYKIASTNSEDIATALFAKGDRFIVMVYKNAAGVGNLAFLNRTFNTQAVIPALTLSNYDGSSWAVNFATVQGNFLANSSRPNYTSIYRDGSTYTGHTGGGISVNQASHSLHPNVAYNITLAFEILASGDDSPAVLIKAYNGTEFVPGKVKGWNGTEWVGAKSWNSTEWV